MKYEIYSEVYSELRTCVHCLSDKREESFDSRLWDNPLRSCKKCLRVQKTEWVTLTHQNSQLIAYGALVYTSYNYKEFLPYTKYCKLDDPEDTFGWGQTNILFSNGDSKKAWFFITRQEPPKYILHLL